MLRPGLLLLLASGLVLATTEDCFDYDTDYSGNDVWEGHYNSVPSAADCQRDCQAAAACLAWTWDQGYHGACWHKTAANKSPHSGLVSGPKYCGDSPTPDPSDGGSLRLLSYNMFGWNALVQNPWKAENMYKAIRANNPDLLGAQEVENMAGTVAAALGSDYRVAGESSAGHTVIYRQSALSLDSWATAELHEQDEWGPRTLEWAMFTHKASGRKVDHFNTHLCVCSGDQLLGSARTIAENIAAHRRPGSLLILTGDFNVMSDHYEDSKAIRYLKGELESSPVPLVDTFRQANGGGEDGTTFPGLGKIDYVLTEAANTVTSAAIDRHNYGDASDHLPINAVLQI